LATADLDNIRNAGFNVVRAPIWWGQFYLLNNHTASGWRADAFEVLDWLVNACAARGIYVIIDMHGVVGGLQWVRRPGVQTFTTTLIGPGDS
jgi:endoglucanase